MAYGAYLHLETIVISLIIIRLCVETPTAGGRVFEKGDEYLLKFAHDIQSALLTPFLLHINSLVIINQFPLYSSLLSTTD